MHLAGLFAHSNERKGWKRCAAAVLMPQLLLLLLLLL
jgi:hypothetical protein